MAAAEHQVAQLEVLSPDGPSVAYHIGWMANGALYIHGGIEKVGSKSPSFRLHRYDLDDGAWSEVRAEGSPALSHHSCVVVAARFAVIIGGWTGHERTPDVHVFDMMSSRWSKPRTMGFPVGAGLSSHSAVLLATSNILVLGREGSLRMQRKFGSMFLLRGDAVAGDAGVFTYSEFPLATASRSGHTAHIVGSTLVVVGGRDDQIVEKHAVEKGSDNPHCEMLGHLERKIGGISAKPMTGRKQHTSVCGCGVLFVHGGWTFDGKTRDPVGQMFALLVKSNWWVCLGESGVRRAGHVCCCDGKHVLLHGGEGARGVVHGTLHRLVVNS